MVALQAMEPEAMEPMAMEWQAVELTEMAPMEMAPMEMESKAMAPMEMESKAMAPMEMEPEAMAPMEMEPEAMAPMAVMVTPVRAVAMGWAPKVAGAPVACMVMGQGVVVTADVVAVDTGVDMVAGCCNAPPPWQHDTR